MGPTIGVPDQFALIYTAKFKALLASRGLFINYEIDRVGIDLGLHLFKPTSRRAPTRPSLTKVWFQLKGHGQEAFPASRLADMVLVPCSELDVGTVRFWLASPEVVYLVVYLEATNEFIGEDVRDIVGRQAPEALADFNLLGKGHRTITLHVDRRAVLDEAAFDRMLNHGALRIDGPQWRGRPLGHNLDPLRSEVNQLGTTDYQKLVDRLLEAHGYDVREVFPLPDGVEDVTLTQGVMHSTYEWTQPLFTEFGFGEGETLRIESDPFYVQGPCAVLIDARQEGEIDLSNYIHATCERLHADGEVKQLLAFINRTNDFKEFGAIHRAARPLDCMPQDLGSLTFNLLTATSIYLEFRENISWKYINYLLEWRRQG
jgi:Domain of unknown function (DUF4365)